MCGLSQYLVLIGSVLPTVLVLAYGCPQYRDCCDEDNTCPIWQCKNKAECIPAECDKTMVTYNSNGTTELLLSMCMTFNNETNKTYVLSCPYDTGKGPSGNMMPNAPRILLNTTKNGLNEFMCARLNREGMYCKHCKPSFGQSVLTPDLSCYSCEGRYSGWILYLTLELVPLTTFLVIMAIFQLLPTTPKMNIFVLSCQVISSFITFGTQTFLKYSLNKVGIVLLEILRVFYGFWNLDFFRNLIPPFCVDPRLNNLGVLALNYITVIYPTAIILVAWIVVDLYERGFRPIVAIWRPFRRGLSHYSITSNPKRILVSYLCAVVVLSYTKVVVISANLMHTTTTFALCDKSEKVLFLQPDVGFFSPQHSPYIFLSLIMLLLYVALPLLMLIIYSLPYLRDKFNAYCIRSHNVQDALLETFFSCYHDGCYCRLFSTAYFFFRIICVLLFLKTPSLLTGFLCVSVLEGVMLGLLCFMRPYRKTAQTIVDAVFFFAFIVGSVFSTAVVASETGHISNPAFHFFLFSVIYLSLAVPFLYGCVIILLYVTKCLRRVKIALMRAWRQKGYVEIVERYGNESVTSGNASYRR